MSRRAPSEAIPAAAIVAAARALVGVPFRHQGRSVRGLDCMGLCVRAHQAAGLAVADRTDYGRQPDLAAMKAALDAELVRLPRIHGLDLGLVLMFHDVGWLHVGICTGDGVIHSRGPEGIGRGVVEHRIDAQSWAPRLKGLWAHPGVSWGA